MSTVHSENKISCDQCDLTFSRSECLKRHIKGVHEDNKFECEQCDFISTRKDKLKRHMNIKHGAKKPRIEIKTDYPEEREAQDII